MSRIAAFWPAESPSARAVRLVVGIAVSYGVAALSFNLWERRFLQRSHWTTRLAAPTADDSPNREIFRAKTGS